MRDGVEAQVQALEREPELAAVLHLLDVAQHDKRVEQPEGRRIVESGAPGDLREQQLRLVAGESLEHAETLRERVDDVLVGSGRHAVVRNANNYSDRKSGV